MPSVPKISAHVRLTLTVLLIILLTWVLNSASAYIVTYRDVQAVRQAMLAHPEIYPKPIPPPRFDVLNFLFGTKRIVKPRPRPVANAWGSATGNGTVPTPPEGVEGPPPIEWAPENTSPPPNPPDADSNRLPPPGGNGQDHVSGLVVLLRLTSALLLAIFAGAWLHWQFSRPLIALEKGARALRQGQFDYHLQVKGDDEFTAVARTMNEMAEQVSSQIAKLEDDAKRRQQFLADVAHELRSPVTTMRTMAGALEEGLADDPERRERAVQAMVRTSDRLLHLVNDLLELARLDLQQLPLHTQPVDLRELIPACLQHHTAAAAQAGMTLVEPEPGGPVLIHGDPDRLTQVLDNLLDNAISHAGNGAQLSVTLVNADPVQLIVADTGQGIAAKHLPYLFDAFYRASVVRTPGDKHSGLGLRIARSLVEAQGGAMTLDSAEGKGTAVTLTFPRDVALAPTTAKT